MRYLVTGNLKPSDLPRGCSIVAQGEAVALEEPWTFGPMLIARVKEGYERSMFALREKPGVTAFTVTGLSEPNAGTAFAIGAHLMKDAEGMAPYIAGVPPVIAKYNCNYLARTGDVAHAGGEFKPDRVAIMQFPDAATMVDFYTCDGYAPLLPIRLKCTLPRMMLLMKEGAIPPSVRDTITQRLPKAQGVPAAA